jgi:hypothetical protein
MDKNAINDAIKNISISNPEAYKKYIKLIGKKSLSGKDRLSVLAYIIDPNFNKAPFCTMPVKDRVKEARKIGLKKGKKHGVAALILAKYANITPDDEFKLESSGKKRKKLDAFDKLSLDKKIEWTRYFESFVGHENFDNLGRKIVRDQYGMELLTYAMKYACKLSGIPYFQGNFASSFWISYRARRYSGIRTEKEHNVLMSIINENKNKLEKIIDANKALELSLNTIKSLKLTNRYEESLKKHKVFKHDSARKLSIIKELIDEKFNA